MFRQGSFLDRLQRSFSGTGVGPKDATAPGMEYGFLPPSLQTIVNRYFGLPPTWNANQAQHAYSDNPWVKSAIDVIANEVARTKFKLVRDVDGDAQEVEHQAMETLLRPQPTGDGKSILTALQLKFLLTQYLFLNGESLWVLDGRNKGGSPTIITPMNPAYTWERLSSDNRPDKYIYRFLGTPTGEYEIDAGDVVHFRFPDPKNWYRGHSPIQSIRFATESYREADLMNAYQYKNRAVPAGTLETDKNVSPDERQKLANAWKEAQGGPENYGKVAILPNGFKFNTTQQTNHDMEFNLNKQTLRDEILANFRVGMEMFGKSESKTRSNADASIYVFARFTILPVLELIADILTNDYLPAFPNVEDLYFTFDDPVPENEDNKRATATTLFQSGAASPDEIRQMFGMDGLDLPGTKTTYVPFNVVPVDPALQPEPQQPTQQPGDEQPSEMNPADEQPTESPDGKK